MKAALVTIFACAALFARVLADPFAGGAKFDFHDFFTRADGAIGASYEIINTDGAFAVSSNTVRHGAGSGTDHSAPSVLLASGTFKANQYCEIEFTSLDAGLDLWVVDLWVRGTGTDTADITTYGCFIDSTGALGFYALIAGASGSAITGGGAGFTSAPVAGDKFGFGVFGSTLFATKNGAILATATDTQITATGRPGFAGYIEEDEGTNLYVTLDNFAGFDLE